MGCNLKLYKYMPAQFSDAFVKNGDMLFRNLSYFRQHEDNKRGDPLEGFHRDKPDNNITIAGRELSKGDYSFLNATNTDSINIFCLSTRHEADLYEEFESDCCVEILDPGEFIRKATIAVKKLVSAHKSGLLHMEVKYYKDNMPAGFDIKNSQNLAFAKGVHYRHQDEYRLAFGTKKAFNLTQRIVVNATYDFTREARKGIPKEKHIRIGNINGITKVHYT